MFQKIYLRKVWIQSCACRFVLFLPSSELFSFCKLLLPDQWSIPNLGGSSDWGLWLDFKHFPRHKERNFHMVSFTRHVDRKLFLSFFTWCLYFSLVDKSMAVTLDSLCRGWCNSRTSEFLYAVLAVLAWCYKALFNDLLSSLYFRHRSPINSTIINITTIFSITWNRK